MVDLKEAFERVAHLDRFPFEDQQPNIEAVSLSVLYDGFIDYNFADRAAFDTKFSDETASLANLVKKPKTKKSFFIFLIFFDFFF